MTSGHAGPGRVILGVDPGRRRVGIAVAAGETRLARPVEVVDASTTDVVARIAELVDELGADTVVVGRPVGMSGRPGPAVREQEEFLRSLRDAVHASVTEFDERLTTVVAERGLRAGGAGRTRGKELRDAVAAQVLLQDYLDSAGNQK
jgi:putative Holliday junction resolvase